MMIDLKNKVVMVHPALTQDPVNMQGHMGKIELIDFGNDEIVVRFKNQMIGLYSADALLMLAPGLEILDKVRVDSEEFDRYDFLDLLNVYLMDAGEYESNRREALEMALGNQALASSVVLLVQDYIDLHRDFDGSIPSGPKR